MEQQEEVMDDDAQVDGRRQSDGGRWMHATATGERPTRGDQ